ncbi:putative aspartate aminotransferase cytoplasmic-like [Scophthalmus maximus]|uniref:aspartate transaminase n=1 Tax=Scophthalmus maximus TaxID=52904 RepID=A0A2U9BS02_SCOMX|nr:putative aspartate aminotransferase, cytoplasmic 2 [Scophthalmus maximus]AWP06831.1 putative aspartate aminotransferase cytoplasmic-like [Scophthalmus maximus]
MSRPSSGRGETRVKRTGCAGGHLPALDDARASSPEARLLSAFRRDAQHASKVYLGGREYYSEDGKTFELPLVGKIKRQLSADPTFCPEYPSPLGLTEFTRRATEVALGENSRAAVESRVLGVQTPSFTAAVRLGAELLRHWTDVSAAWCGPVYLSSPCDDSLAGIFQAAGIRDIRQYYYWDEQQRCICLEKLLEDLERAPERSVVVLSASAHYPTGADLTQNQWAVITQLMTRRRLLPFLLLPAQALCFGDLKRDAWPVQHCASQGMELLCAQSFSHCFGLYGEAVGHLVCVLKQNSLLLSVKSQAVKLVRSLWAQPSAGGAHVVATVLSNPAHLVECQGEVRRIVERCMLIRDILREKLRLLGTPGCWDHLTQQSGLYCCTGLNDQQVEFLSKRRHVYLLPSGCLNVSAINGHNLKYISESIHLALTTSP